MTTGERRVRDSDLTALLVRIFAGAGVPAADAAVVADGLVGADLRGVGSHGAMLAPMYVDRILAGSVRAVAELEVVSETPGGAVLDAHHSLGQVSGDRAMALAIAKASEVGVGVVAVRHAFHFGGAFRYVAAAAAAGCIGIAASNTRPLMPAPGGARAVVGNSPIAVGVPRAGGEPIILDMALSEAALGKVRLAAAAGQEIPPTWATDRGGRPTTDATAALDGMLLPMGGHKGFGLALVVDVLSGVLSGGSFGGSVQGLYADMTVPNDCAHVFVALRADAFTPDFAERVADLAGQVLDSPPAEGVQRVYLPGEIEDARAHAAEESGIVLPASVVEGLRSAAAAVGVTTDELDRMDGVVA